LDELARRLKKRCGSGGTVREGKIEIQGDHQDTLLLELGKLGYSAKRAGG
jgi:translation initiation factor 1